MAATPVADGDVHERLCRLMHPLTPSRSTLLNGISSHVVADAITLTQLDHVSRSAQQLHPRIPLFIGSIDGKIRVSARLEVAVPTEGGGGGTKRPRQSESEEKASAVVAGVRKRMDGPVSSATEEQLEVGRRVVQHVVELRGSGGESVLEAIGLSATAPQAAAARRRPSLTLSARFTPGVAIPLRRLRAAIGACVDGALTTTPNGLGGHLELPTPSNASTLAEDGQLPIFLHAAIPEPAGGVR